MSGITRNQQNSIEIQEVSPECTLNKAIFLDSMEISENLAKIKIQGWHVNGLFLLPRTNTGSATNVCYKKFSVFSVVNRILINQ